MKYKRFSEKQILFIGFSALFLLLVLLIGGYLIGRKLEEGDIVEERGEVSTQGTNEESVTYNNVVYHPRNKLATILVMGIDNSADESRQTVGNGQADFLLLLVLDADAQTVTPLQIDRDTMTTISVTNMMGKATGLRTSQICLSHGFGQTAEQSCELTQDAVSRFLEGVPIDDYIALDMDGISVLNDALGGITVTLTDDFSFLDASMRAGETVTLQGEQAEYYVRQRYGIGDSTNSARMLRQRDYLDKFSAALSGRIKANVNFIGSLFDMLSPYMTTSFKRGRMVNTAYKAKDYAAMEICRPDGTYAKGEDGFVEFHADDESVRRLVLGVFYSSDDT